MKQEKSPEGFESLRKMPVQEVMTMVETVLEAFPLVVLSNLTKNTYTMLRHDGFLAGDIPFTGCYDDLIDYGVSHIHPNYQKVFLDCFSRDRLLKSFCQGKKEVYAELYQMSRNGRYHWVSTHVIRVKDKDGDICELCMNRVLEERNRQPGKRI